MTILDRAIAFSVSAHAGAFRRDGVTPYILHCTETAAIAATMTSDPEVLAAAVLHDVLEDTDTTRQTLLTEFGPRVSELVTVLTENTRPELPPESTWLVRKEEIIDVLDNTGDMDVLRICLADKLSNLRGIHRDYLRLEDELWELFHQKSRAKQGWYYHRLEEALSPLSDTAAYWEFSRLRREIFEHKSI